MKPKILNAEPYQFSAEASRVLEEIGHLTSLHLDRNGLLNCIGDFNVLIIRLAFNIDREVIDAGRNLKVLVSATTGLDHIDVEYALSKGIRVLSLQGEIDFLRTIKATAEHTWALLLSLMRNIRQASLSTLDGIWDRDLFRGHDLAGKRLGIVGLGRIGEMVAHYGLAFGMQVFAYDPYRKDWLQEVERCSDLGDILKVSDVLSLHTPLNEKTYHLIGINELKMLPKRAVLINTSRGGVLDSFALLKSLQEGCLEGAALDVIEGELDRALLMNNPLLIYAREHSNLLITPHIGGATFESMANTELFMSQKLKDLYGLWD